MEESHETGHKNELASFVAALWAKRWWVIVGALISAVVTVAAVLVRVSQYEATARMAVVEFHVAAVPPSGPLDQTYAQIIRSQTVARDIVEQYGLGEELDLTPVKLLDRVTVQPVPGTSLIDLSVELPDPQLALDVTRAFAEGAEIRTREINELDRRRARGVLETQLEQASAEVERIELEVAASGGAAALTTLGREQEIYLDRKQALEEDWMALFLTVEEQKNNLVSDRLDEAKAALTAINQERRPQALRVLLERTLYQWSTFRAERDGVSATLAGERARLQQAEAELGLKERVLDISRTLEDENLLVQAQRNRQSGGAAPLSLTSEYLNPVYEALDMSVSTTRAEVEALSERLAGLDRLVDEYAARAEALERDFADVDSVVETRARAAELALEEYRTLYEKAPAGVQVAIDVIEQQLAETEVNIGDVQARLAAREAAVRRLEAEYNAALQVRADLARRLESSEVTVAGQLSELMMVDPPILPETTSNTSAFLLVIAVTFLGTLLSLLLAAVAAGVEAVPPAD